MNPVVITGATGAIGSAAVRMMAEKGYPVIMACRDVKKGEQCMSKVLAAVPEAQVRVMALDLSSLASVKGFAHALAEEGAKLAGLFNNAAVMNCSYRVTEDGLENTVQVNFVSPALLSRWLLPMLESDGHVVNMVSLACRTAHIDTRLLEMGKDSFRQIGTYGKSKLALLLFTIALSHNANVHVNLADPGIVDSKMIQLNHWIDPLTDLLFRPCCKSPQQGAKPAVNALLTDETLRYFCGNKCRGIPMTYLSNPLIHWTWEAVDTFYKRFVD